MEMKTIKNILLSQSIDIEITLFNIEFTPICLWIRPWMKSITILGVGSGNFLFHVFYLEFFRNIKDEKVIRFEIFGIKNFKWSDDE